MEALAIECQDELSRTGGQDELGRGRRTGQTCLPRLTAFDVVQCATRGQLRIYGIDTETGVMGTRNGLLAVTNPTTRQEMVSDPASVVSKKD